MIEGSPYSNLLKLMKNQGYNKDVSITTGLVTSPSPLTIQIGELTLSGDDLYQTQTAQKAGLATNDIVLVVNDGADFFVIDKVVG
jgi:hypothetical protein